MYYPSVHRRSYYPKGKNVPVQDVSCYEIGINEVDPVHGIVRSERSSKDQKRKLRGRSEPLKKRPENENDDDFNAMFPSVAVKRRHVNNIIG